MDELKQGKRVFEDFEDFEKPDTDKLSHFPIEALPPVVGNYALAISESLQVSEDMAAVAVLGIMSLSVMGNFYIEPKTDWFCLLYTSPSPRDA